MTPHLHVGCPARDARAWFWNGANPAEAPPPRVLCEETNRRLALVNAAIRALRGFGLRAVAISIEGEFPAEGGPSLRIARDPAQSLEPFLDVAGPARWMCLGRDGVTLKAAACEFAGVWVLWEDAQ